MRCPDVDRMLEGIPAQQVLWWMAFFAVRHEKDKESQRNRELGIDDDEVIHW